MRTLICPKEIPFTVALIPFSLRFIRYVIDTRVSGIGPAEISAGRYRIQANKSDLNLQR